MEIVDFGRENTQSIMLVPGNMMSWRQFEHVIPLLSNEYHVAAVSLDGFDGTGETTFTTAETAAEKLAAYIDENLGGHTDLLFGESLGCATAAILFYRQAVKVDALILNGAQHMDLGPLNGLFAHIVPKGQLRFMERAKSAKRLPLLMRLFTRSDDDALLREFDGLAEGVSLETLENAMREALRLYGALGDLGPQPGRRVSIWYGAKEPNMKKAIAALTRVWPDADVHPFEGMGHGEIVAYPQEMAAEIRRFMNGESISGRPGSLGVAEQLRVDLSFPKHIKDERIDGGKPFDWGRVSDDYAEYRDIYPDEFYRRIVERGLCVDGQRILDVGTGTGVLPRNMHGYGGIWTGTDISEGQIAQAKRLSRDMGIEYYVSPTEQLDFPDESFDVITACQCFWYFDHKLTAPLFHRLLKPAGKLLILYMAWLPFEDEIANASEQLVLKYSPQWSGAGETVHPIDVPSDYFAHFDLAHHEEWRLSIPFTRESWHGRMRACRGVGASLPPDTLQSWEDEHWKLLLDMAPERFTIMHYAALTELTVR